MHDPIQAFLREHDLLGLLSIIRRQSSFSCASAGCNLKDMAEPVVWAEMCLSLQKILWAMGPVDADPTFSYKSCEAAFELMQHTEPSRCTKDSQPRGVWLG